MNASIHWPKAVNEIPKAIFTNAELYEREIETIFHGVNRAGFSGGCLV